MKRWRSLTKIALLAAAMVGGRSACGDGEPYRDINLPFEKRVADLVSRLTLQEKATQMLETVPANPQRGIPAVQWWTETIHGVSRAGQATTFPQAIAQAATWDPELLKKIGDACAIEARYKADIAGATRYRGIILWAPVVNVVHDPRWGRCEESYGEDPYLTGRLGVAYVQGAQGDGKYLKAVATPKHFAMYSQESERRSRCFDCPETVLRDYYLPPFHDCIVEGKATSIMSAFDGINKVPCTANFWLLTDVLRREWNFDGAVVTDWCAVTDLMVQQRYVTNIVDGVSQAINAGVDVISDQNRPNIIQALVSAVNDHSIKQEVLDRALTRNLMLRFRLGMFDPADKVPYANKHTFDPATDAHTDLAYQAAAESMVLLKNDPVTRGFGAGKLLPLDLRRIDSIAVLGPYANNNYFGVYSPDSPAGPTPTLVNSLRSAVGDRVVIRSETSMDAEFNARVAEQSSVCIFVCGLNGTIEKEGADRSSLLLPSDQLNLLQRVVKANPATIVVLECGSPVALAAIREQVPALMVAWYPGEQGNKALTQMLLGQVNPSGKLPVTFYRANDDLPPIDDYDIRKGRTYMYATKPPTYPFGAGLSYTTFEYRNLKVSPVAGQDGMVTATLEVANTGSFAGDEVVQLYVHAIDSKEKRPIKQLKAFQRVSIPAGQSKQVTLNVPVANLGFWDVASKKYLPEKAYDVMVGSSSEDIRGKGQVQIK